MLYNSVKLQENNYTLILLLSLIIIFGYIYLYLKKHSQETNLFSCLNMINDLLNNIGQEKVNHNLHNSNARESLIYVSQLSGDEFEIYMVRLLNSIGFKNVKHTPFSGDGGLDAIGYMPNGKTKVGWQFKHYNHGDMGYRAVEETICGGVLNTTDTNYLITNGTKITVDAIKRAKQINQNQGKQLIHIQSRTSLYKYLEMNANQEHFNGNMKIVTNISRHKSNYASNL